MNTKIMKCILKLGLAGVMAWILLSVSSPLATSAAPLAEHQSTDVPPCELSGPVMMLSPGSITTMLPGEGTVNLVITCLRFDRTHYAEGMTWEANFIVKNFGTTTSEDFNVYGHLCRQLADGIGTACQDNFGSAIPLAMFEPGLGPGESRLLEGPVRDFTDLPSDGPGFYDSWVQGYPDNGTVYLKAAVGGSPTNGYTVTSAIYPSAPYDPARDEPGYIDEDGDGWSPPEDCDDNNPDIHDGMVEIIGNNADDECVGGEVSQVPSPCPANTTFIYRNSCDAPGMPQNPDLADWDQDGYQVSDNDCDDFSPLVNPGATEWPDGIDNNCNGLIDEGHMVPDWVIESFTLERDSEYLYISPSDDIFWYLDFPGLRYEVEIGNQGAFIGNDFSSVPVLILDPDHGNVISGASGFIPYGLLTNGADFACTYKELIAEVPDGGVFSELNTSNNSAEAQVEHITYPDRALVFENPPAVYYDKDDAYLILVPNEELLGTCPPVPSDTSGPYIEIYSQVTVEGELVYNAMNRSGEYIPYIYLSQPLSNHDIVCLEITLDPNWFVMEDHTDNMFVRILEFHNPLFGEYHFDELVSDIGLAGAGWSYAGVGCGGIGSDSQPLTTGSAANPQGWIGMILVSLVGGGIGLLGGRRFNLGRVGSVLLTTGGVALGGFVGFSVGSDMAPTPAQISVMDGDQAASVQPFEPGSLDPGGFFDIQDTCEDYFETSAETITNKSGDIEDVIIHISVPNDVSLPADYRFMVTVWDNNNSPRIFATNSSLVSLADAGLFPDQISSPLEWQVGLEELAGPGGDLFLPYCIPDGMHTFVFGDVELAKDKETPTPTATSIPVQPDPVKVPPTATFTPVSDNQGPKVGGVSDKPDPIYTSGTSPDVSTVSASVNDPSGVASVILYYRSVGKSKGGFQVWGAMPGSGGSYSTVFGPFASAGTYEYRVRAVDNLGNANCGTKNLGACPGGTLTVSIP